MKAVVYYKRACDVIQKILQALCVVLLAYIVIMVFIEAAIRVTLNSSLKYTEEIVLFCVPWISYVGGAVALREKALVSINALGKLPPIVAAIASVTCNVLIMLLLAYITQSGLAYTLTNIAQVSAGMRMSMSVQYVAVPLGAFFMFLFSLENVLDTFTKQGGEPDVG